MKKLIAILAVMIVLAGVVFATTDDKITLKSHVGRIKPGFVIFSGSAAVNTTITTDVPDLSESDISWSFELKQSGNEDSKTYSRYKGAVTLTVTINPFTSTLGSQSTAYEIQETGTAKGTEVENKLTLANPTIAENLHSVQFVLTYAGKKVTDTEAAHLGTIAVKWTKDENLPMADAGTDYTTDVVLTYTVN